MAKQLKHKAQTATQPSAPTFGGNKVVTVGSREEQLYLKKLQDDFKTVDADFVSYAEKQQPYAKKRAEMKKHFSGMNEIFLNQMLMTCIAPLQDGLNADSAISCVCMYIGMRVASKDFKQHSDNMKNKLLHGLYSHKAEKDGPDSDAAKKAEGYRQKVVMAANGGRTPLSPRSAALTNIAITQSAYRAMHQPGADVEKIMTQYSDAIDALHDQCVDDGVSIDSMHKHMRSYVGQMSERQPEMATMFKELSYDGVKRAPYHIDSNNPNRKIWTGEYLSKDGSMHNGGFTPRIPLTADSAARDKLNLVIGAYKDMRRPGANPDEIMQSYHESVARLDKMCALDGVSGEDVDKAMRVRVCAMIEKDPKSANLFAETCHDELRPELHRNPDNPSEAIWTGEFVTRDGQLFTGGFTPRVPQTADDFAKMKIGVVQGVYHEMRRDPAHINDAVIAFERTMKRIGRQCRDDGIDIRDVDRQARIYVGDACSQRPEIAVMFDELSYAGVHQSAAHADPTCPGGSTWTGEYETKDGKSFDSFFTPRVPYSKNDHMDDWVPVVEQQFEDVASADDLHLAIMRYDGAYNHVFEGHADVDADLVVDPEYQDCVKRMQMLKDDGMSDDDAKSIFSLVMQVGQSSVSPDVLAEYRNKYGQPAFGDITDDDEIESEPEQLTFDDVLNGTGSYIEYEQITFGDIAAADGSGVTRAPTFTPKVIVTKKSRNNTPASGSDKDKSANGGRKTNGKKSYSNSKYRGRKGYSHGNKPGDSSEDKSKKGYGKRAESKFGNLGSEQGSLSHEDQHD